MELTIARQDVEAGEAGRPDRTTLVLEGSIDLVTRQALLDEGLRVLTAGGRLTLDLAEIDFIDSTGVGALVELAGTATKHGSELIVSRRSARVARVLQVIGLEQAWLPDVPSDGALAGGK